MTNENGMMRRLKATMLKRVHGMITCREFEEFIIQYLEDELPRKQKRVFEWHLRICRECREYLAAYERSIEISKATLGTASEAVPDEVPEDLIKAILDARKT